MEFSTGETERGAVAVNPIEVGLSFCAPLLVLETKQTVGPDA
jgi:hypothetical protein